MAKKKDGNGADKTNEARDIRPDSELPPICDCPAMEGPHRHMPGGPEAVDPPPSTQE